MSLTKTDLKAIGYIVEKTVDDVIDNKVTPRFNELYDKVDMLATSTAAGFNEMTERFNRVDERLDALESETARLSGNISGLRRRVDSHDQHFRQLGIKSA